MLQVVQVAAVACESLDDPVGEPEQADLFRRRGVDGQAEGVVGVTLGLPDLRGVAVPPHRAFVEEQVRGRPGDDEQQCLPPPPVRGEHDGGRQTGDEADQAVGDEVHGDRQRRGHDAEVEVAGHRQVGSEVGSLEVGDARRLERRRHQPVIERCRRAIAEVVAERLVQRPDHL